jgi:hypothetical protein
MGADEKPAGGAIGNATLWLGILGPPTLWLHQLLINYIFVSWACRHEQNWPLHLVSIASLLATVTFGALLFMQWQRISGPSRAKFMALLGWLSSALFFLAMLTQEIAAALYNPCLH